MGKFRANVNIDDKTTTLRFHPRARLKISRMKMTLTLFYGHKKIVKKVNNSDRG